jgi:hypothetical protein
VIDVRSHKHPIILFSQGQGGFYFFLTVNLGVIDRRLKNKKADVRVADDD